MADRAASQNGDTPVVAEKKHRLPAFLDHFNARDLKIFVRCWVAIWVASLLIFINPTLASIGTATFFAALVLLMIPPSGIVFITLLGSLSLFIGICLAWAWGVIVMKAAQAARPAADTQARMASLQQTAVTQANRTGVPTASVAQQLIFDGYMLDARVSAVTFCLLCVFIYLLARLRASNPKATLTAIFGIIITDLFLNFTPLLPSFNGTLPLALVKPAAIGVGLGVACSVLFFPRSTSHVVLDSMEDIVTHLKQPLTFTAATLGQKAQELDIKRLHKIRVRIIEEYRKMEPALAFLPLDFSVGCWGAADVALFTDPMRKSVSAILSLLDFHITRIYGEVRTEDVLRDYVNQAYGDADKDGDKDDEKRKRKPGGHQLARLAEFLDGLRSPDNHELSAEVVDDITRISVCAIDACIEGLDVIKECIHLVNCRRWFWRPSATERQQLATRGHAAVETLHKARVAFVHDMTEILVKQHVPFEAGSTPTERAEHVGGIIVGMVFEEHMASTMDHVSALLSRIVMTYTTSTRVRLWWPISFKYAATWLSGKKTATPSMAPAPDTDPDDQLAQDLTQTAQENLRRRRAYRPQKRSPVGRAILGTYHWFTSNEGLFALRMVVVTIALGIPGVIPHTAGFYYREKGLWGLIMAQTGLVVYMADFTFAVISRVVGTVAGGVLGLLAWYIGSGNGPGNPYGLSAVLAVMLAIFLWVRLYLPPNLLQGGIMGGATFLLVVAYSYVDTHIPQYGNPGVGYTVFWRRLLLVLVGVAAATIVQLFPHPPSAARHICKTLSHTLRTLSDHYALLLSIWGRPSSNATTPADSNSTSSPDTGTDTDTATAQPETITEQSARREKVNGSKEQGTDPLPPTLLLTETLLALNAPISLLRYEFSSSRFTSTNLAHITALAHSMNRSLGRLLTLSSSLPTHLQHKLSRQTGLLDHRAIGEVMAVLGVCEQALKTGDAPPEILPAPLVRRALETWIQRVQEGAEEEVTVEAMREESYRRYCVGLSAYLRFLSAVDELVLVVKGVLGEAHLVDHHHHHHPQHRDEYQYQRIESVV